MKLIVISTPHFFNGEADVIFSLMEEGLEIFHLRKPEGKEEELRQLLKQIPDRYHNRIVLHDAFNLAKEFQVKGIHLNSRNREIPDYFTGSVSRSCHTLEEVINSSNEKVLYNYVFLSPIFNSISKEGYVSGFPTSTLAKAKEKGILTSKVIALGGIDITNITQIKALGFGGAAVLGFLWGKYPTLSDKKQLTERFKLLRDSITK
ncbi:thiamine phosphate synthase [Parabacteroides pacaensis]|uniref:thiamine phosphate synthase n=1 Tax=Parabacteroides pacaensis TaxID=2086575 RepID=UPI000D10A435|nr:thiamine phosphate synthase [Parabacteroides pacaensis]